MMQVNPFDNMAPEEIRTDVSALSAQADSFAEISVVVVRSNHVDARASLKVRF